MDETGTGPVVSTTTPASARTDVGTSNAEPPGEGVTVRAGRLYPAAARAAGVLLPLGAALILLSTVFDPKSTEPEPRGTYVAYGADRAGADIAATILHYGFGLFGAGMLLAAVALVAGRGRVLTAVGGGLGALGFLNLSGVVLVDWFDAYNASVFGPDRALEISEAVGSMPGLVAGWFVPMQPAAALGPVLLAVGLARARVVTWWVLPVVVLAVAGLLVSSSAGQVVFLGAVVLTLVYGVVLGTAFWRRSGASS